MSAVRQAHAEDRVAGLERREEHRLVGLRPGMRLDIREVGVEELPGTVDRQLLGDIDVLATAVVALARIALGVLVRELRALGRHHGRARVVLRRDQLDVLFLPPILGGDGGREFRIGLGDGMRTMEHGGGGFRLRCPF